MVELLKAIGRHWIFEKIRTAIIWCVFIALSSCAGNPVRTTSIAKDVAIEEAVALPPAGGPAVVGVIERRYSNALAQEILLATIARTPGQNVLSVKVFGTSSPLRMGSGDLAPASVTESKINEEIRQALPGVVMRRSGYYVQNQFGPFGYATGSGTDGEACLYAWQQVRSKLGQVSPFANAGMIQVRLRLCQAGATPEQLLGFMYGYTLTAAVDSGSWNPYGDVVGPPATFGQNAAPMYPYVAGLAPAAAPVTVVQSSRPQQTAAAAPVSGASAAPAGPVVPSPGTYAAVQPPAAGASVNALPGTGPVAGPRVPSPADIARQQKASSSKPAAQNSAAPLAEKTIVPSPSCLTRSGVNQTGTCE